MAVIRKGSASSRATLTDNVTKETTAKDHNDIVEVPSKEGKVAFVRTAASVKLSMGFQSVGVDIGVEIPWGVSQATLSTDLKEAFEFAEKIVDKKIADRVEEARSLLKQLGK